MNESRTDSADAAETWVCVAAIAGAFGVRGEVKIKPFTAEPKACVTYGPLYDERGQVVLTPKSSRPVKNALAVRAVEVETREQAEALKSVKLYVPRSALPPADEDEFYYTDLIGLAVETLSGAPRGHVHAVHDFGGGDVLEILTKGEKNWYHPFTKDAVPRVDLAGGRVVIDEVEPEVVRGDDD